MLAFGKPQMAPQMAPPFTTKKLGAVAYRKLNEPYVSPTKGALIGWKIRSIEKYGDTEVATATPYLESTGSRDPGDAFKWTDIHASKGRGIIIEPPLDWAGPFQTQALMHMRVGQLQIIATDDYDWLGRAAEGIEGIVWIVSPRGFVLYEPKGGWKNVSDAPPEPSKPEPYEVSGAFNPWYFGAAAILLATGAVMLWVDR